MLCFLLIGSFLFYWYQIRPAQIKHECSWIKKHSDAIPARPAMTETELRTKGLIRTCPTPTITPAEGYMPLEQRRIFFLNLFSCENDNKQVIAEYKNAKPAVPAKDWYEAATKEEYTFCLHDKGL